MRENMGKKEKKERKKEGEVGMPRFALLQV